MIERSKVREPFQVYLDPADRTLLDEVAERTGLSRAEILYGDRDDGVGPPSPTG